MYKELTIKYRVEMIIGRKVVRKVVHNGATYLPVEVGREFEITLHNSTNKRVVGVVSVDGLSVMNGEDANYNNSGYVIPAYGSYTVKGWRRGDSEVASFEVTKPGSSYAEKTGRPNNVGVIGVIFYPEKIEYTLRGTLTRNSDGDNTFRMNDIQPRRGICGQSVNATYSSKTTCGFDDDGYEELTSGGIELPDAPVGTGYGRKQADRVRETEFKRDERSKQIVTLYYDTVSNLVAKGVPVRHHGGAPNPFPAEDSKFFCPEP